MNGGGIGSRIGRIPLIMNGGRPMNIGNGGGRIPGGIGGKNLGGIIIISLMNAKFSRREITPEGAIDRCQN